MSDKDDITESRRVDIAWKVFTRADLREFARIVQASISDLVGNKEFLGSVTYELQAEGSRSYESSKPDLMNEDNGIFDRGFVHTFKAYFIGIKPKAVIWVEISHTRVAFISHSHIKVEGNNARWVAATMRQLEDHLASIRPQSLRYKWVRWLIVLLAALGTFTTCMIALAMVNGEAGKIGDGMAALFGIGVPVLVIGVGFGATVLMQRLWPHIEFQTGRDHVNAPARQRKKWYLLVTLVMLPFFLSVIGGVLVAAGWS